MTTQEKMSNKIVTLHELVLSAYYSESPNGFDKLRQSKVGDRQWINANKYEVVENRIINNRAKGLKCQVFLQLCED